MITNEILQEELENTFDIRMYGKRNARDIALVTQALVSDTRSQDAIDAHKRLTRKGIEVSLAEGTLTVKPCKPWTPGPVDTGMRVRVP